MDQKELKLGSMPGKAEMSRVSASARAILSISDKLVSKTKRGTSGAAKALEHDILKDVWTTGAFCIH